MSLTFNHFQSANHCRDIAHSNCVERWSNDQWLSALTGEIGEIAKELVYQSRYEVGYNGGKPLDKRALGFEIADAVTYLSLLASANGINLEECLVEKFNTVSDRIQSSLKL